ncbi:RteC protein [Lutibacter oceani]|uniref:RteC protein n=1 Tax=Lutibacter oceani TaxID=1853311 RepID=A0A3D9RT28_9FLAO|nr:RteC domain-containing protein [Lutibacter oceani]REE80276.1 RteC protein [Lutibacter oceani]
MKEINTLIENYKFKITIVKKSNQGELKKISESIKITREFLNQLRVYIRKNDFTSKEDEIIFFKYQKPIILGQLMYLSAKNTFLIEKPTTSISHKRNFIKKSLKKIEAKKKRNLEFFKYYTHNGSSLDDKYFIRGNSQLELFSNVFLLDKDPIFSTSHDIKAAEVIAYDLITKFYAKEILRLKQEENNSKVKIVKPPILNDLSWTGSKTELVELLYGLNAAGAIRNGQAEMKKLVEVCKELFGIDLGNIYKTYSEIKLRENEPTKFLDLMKNRLLQKMQIE